ncbi:hypothetical protein [Prevotella jejuni]|uniref:hypothetical protein n=1 Tax=Prevotella jejuni TaxID=1177574 RepID=UPI003211A8B3
MSKALLIKSYTNLTTGTQGQWNELNMASSYIQGIETGKILEGLTAEKLAALISGVPTPWARAKLFKFALQTIASPDPNIKASGLQQFYDMLYGEWKGLLATIALFPDRIRFSNPIKMDVKGDEYDIAAAFGRMLFEDKDVWGNQDKLAKNPDEQPFIHLIYYRDHLVGGTSPMTGVFTGVNYANLGDDASDIEWYRDGKFEDPTRYLSPDQLQKVYLFIKNMNSNLEEFEKKINSQRGGKQPISIDGFKQMSRKWEQELLYCGGGNLRDKGPIAKYGNLECPFSLLLKSDVPVYLKPDYTFTYTNNGDYKLIGDIQDLLSDDKFVIGWAEDADTRPKLSDAPVFYLRVKELKDGSMSYFTLPLSERGIDIFKNNLRGLLGYNESGNTSLTGVITDAGQLAVTLIVEIDGQKVTLNTREYEIDWITDLGKVIMWPDFVSERWDKYYLYSEFTADAQEQFQPIFKWQGEFVRTIDEKFWTADYEPSADEDIQIKVKKLITYPAGQGEELPKYNIICADKPLAGLSAFVKDTGRDVHAGYLIFRQDVIVDKSTIDLNGTAVVGIDFGSNNTCVYYNAGDRGANPVEFKNYRTVLVGKENSDTRSIAENNELLFFTNYVSENGQVKSWLHEHDTRYNCYNESEEIAGGVPVNRPNIFVKEMNPYEIKTQAGTLHYNMKWLDNDKGLQKKRAFLKSIWLQTCAFLYKEERIRPEKLRWSYPGSMMEADSAELEKIFEELCRMTPITGGRQPQLGRDLTTEAEAVCSFALSRDFGLNKDNMFLGIDVGGSTSDILLLAKDQNNGNKSSLYRESSVRIAAGVFFNAVIKSESFRQALVSFHEGRKTKVFVANIKEVLTQPSKAPYYLNSIFDQLKSESDYEEFYSSINNNARFVFTIPAYVTGLLLFYSGMLIGKTIKTEKMDHIRRVDVLSFGKGGRLFHWLRSSATQRVTNEYYENCLNAGVNLVTEKNLEVKYRDEIEINNKAEVAMGLVDAKELIKKQQEVDSDICGETGVKYIMNDGTPKELQTEDELTGEYFANEMNKFDFSGVTNFEKFMEIFIDFVSQKTRLYSQADNLREELADLPNRITSYICNNDDEYRKARRTQGDDFTYHQPIIIAEGACFLDTLIKKAFNQ